jgi:thymidylate kinase
MLNETFAAFNLAGVVWCILRGEHDLERPGGDVDLLVSPHSYERARVAVEALGYARLPASGRGSHTFFLSHHLDSDDWIKLDIVTDLSYGPWFTLQTHAEEVCLRRRRQEGKLFVLAPDDSFWTLLLHCLLDKRRIEPHHSARLQELAQMAAFDGPLASVVARASPPGWSPRRILESARRGEWQRLRELAPELARRWARAQPRPVGRRLATSCMARLGEKPMVWFHRRGLSAALIGTDGAGKSTLAHEVRKTFCFPASVVYMGLWQSGDEPDRHRWRSLLRVISRPATIERRYVSARIHQLLGRLVIFDRYTYDAYLPPQPPLAGAKKLYFWVLAHACPAPDVLLLLDAPGAITAARKDEHTPQELECQRRNFLHLRERLPGLEVVDATRPKAEVKAEIAHRIWQHYLARWRD